MKTSTIRMPDQRNVAYNLYGHQAHFPVVFFHDFGSSRNTLVADELWLDRHCWSLVSFDRPGVGASDSRPGYSLCDIADDAALLVEKLGHESCAAIGWSAGAPFAIAFAAAYPELVEFLILISPMPPIGDREYWKLADGAVRWSTLLARYFPGIARRYFFWQAKKYRKNPEKWLQPFLKDLNDRDRRFLLSDKIRRALYLTLEDAWSDPAAGPVGDLAALERPLPFRLEDIRQRVHLWHNEPDNLANRQVRKKLAGAFPFASMHEMSGAGRFGFLNRLEEILYASLW